MGLRLSEFSDRELLHALRELLTQKDSDGVGIKASSFANSLGLKNVDAHHIGARMGWLRKYGVVDRVEGNRWTLTDFGARLLNAKLSATAVRTLGALEERSLWDAMRVMSMAYRNSGVEARNMVRREWLYGTHRNRLNAPRM